MLTQERAEIIARILSDNHDRAKSFLVLEIKEAVAQINALGYDFTAHELNEFGKALKTAAGQSGEIDAETLNGAAGGSVAELSCALPLEGSGRCIW